MAIFYLIFSALAANVALWAVWNVGVVEIPVKTKDRPAIIDHQPQRHLKGDRLSLKEAEPPGEVASIELWGRSGQIVLRDHQGEVALWTDPGAATTVVTKGVSLPQLMMERAAGGPTVQGWLMSVLAPAGEPQAR